MRSCPRVCVDSPTAPTPLAAQPEAPLHGPPTSFQTACLLLTAIRCPRRKAAEPGGRPPGWAGSGLGRKAPGGPLLARQTSQLGPRPTRRAAQSPGLPGASGLLPRFGPPSPEPPSTGTRQSRRPPPAGLRASRAEAGGSAAENKSCVLGAGAWGRGWPAGGRGVRPAPPRSAARRLLVSPARGLSPPRAGGEQGPVRHPRARGACDTPCQGGRAGP